VVLDIAAVKASDSNALLAEIVAVREAVPAPVVLKVIIESAVLSAEAIAVVTRAARAAGVDSVVTSTGFHPAGGATVAAVQAIIGAGEGNIEAIATGGITSPSLAQALIDAGAARIGTSAPETLLA
jgi:Deoxyribose-phosphate aldolase